MVRSGRMQGFDAGSTAARQLASGGGYEVVHESPGLEIGVCSSSSTVPTRPRSIREDRGDADAPYDESANCDRSPDLDEPVDAFRLALGEADAAVRRGIGRDVR